MKIKKCGVIFIAIFTFSCDVLCAGFLDDMIGGRKKFQALEDKVLMSQEIYVAIYPSTGVVHIKEYNMQIHKDRKLQMNTIKDLVGQKSFIAKQFAFQQAESVEEHLFKDRGMITGEYYLKTKTDGPAIFADVFSNLLGQEVRTNYDKDKILIFFTAHNVDISSSEHGEVLGKGDERMIAWPDGSKNYDAVIQVDVGSAYVPIASYFNENVASPGVYFDGSSDEVFEQSIVDITATAFPEQKKKFSVAVLKIMLSLLPEEYSNTSIAEAQKAAWGPARKVLNGKTFTEILDMADLIVLDKGKQALVDQLAKTGTNDDYQYDADIFRLRHLVHYGELLKKYYERNGAYPLQGDVDYQHYVHIATKEQEPKGRPPFKHTVTKVNDFKKILKDGVGGEVVFKYDPQRRPDSKPNFYIYMIDGEYYYLAVHLHEDFSFSNKVAPYYNKLEITNNPNPGPGQWNFDNLLNDKDFQSTLNRKPMQEGFFLELEKQMQ